MKQEQDQNEWTASHPQVKVLEASLTLTRIAKGEKSPKSQAQNKLSSTQKHETKENSNGIPKNINFYRHLMDNKFANENGVEWVLKLRSPKADGHSNEKPEG